MSARCSKPGCGAQERIFNPCTDWDCPQGVADVRALHAAGYRLIGPGELDRETIERCAGVAESYNHWDAEWDDLTPDDAVSRNVTAKSIAAALRSIQGDE